VVLWQIEATRRLLTPLGRGQEATGGRLISSLLLGIPPAGQLTSDSDHDEITHSCVTGGRLPIHQIDIKNHGSAGLDLLAQCSSSQAALRRCHGSATQSTPSASARLPLSWSPPLPPYRLPMRIQS